MTEKKAWQAPKVEELAIDATLGGLVPFGPENVLFSGGPNDGQPIGTAF